MMSRGYSSSAAGDALLTAILEATASHVGEALFPAVVGQLTDVLHTHAALVTRFDSVERTLRTLAFRAGGEWISDYDYPAADTPCEKVIESADIVHFPDHLAKLFPRDHALTQRGVVSYLAAPLRDPNGQVLGHLALLDTRPMPAEPFREKLLRIFAARAAAELCRIRVEAEARERRAQQSNLLACVGDAVVEFDERQSITLINPGAERIFALTADKARGLSLRRFLSDASIERLRRVVASLYPDDARLPLPISEGLEGRALKGRWFRTEAYLACVTGREKRNFTLYMRAPWPLVPPSEMAESLDSTGRSSGVLRPHRLYTDAEVRSFERENMRCTLEICDWIVSGKRGAARLLGVHPSTLASRMKAFQLERPSVS